MRRVGTIGHGNVGGRRRLHLCLLYTSINLEYPWKLIIGDVKVDRSKFTLTEKTATVTDAPKGTGKIKGAVCSKDVCKMLEKDITVR